jgi:hypothetical protein
MRVSTSQLYQQLSAHMSQAASELATMQGKVASGLNYNKPSEAPEIVARAVALESRIKGFANDVESVAKVKLGIDTQASALETSQNLMARLKELSLQGASGQFTQSERNSMAVEVSSLKASLLGLANAPNHGVGASRLLDLGFALVAAGLTGVLALDRVHALNPAGGGGVCDQNAANNSKARSGAPGPNRHFSCSHDLSRSAEL